MGSFEARRDGQRQAYSFLEPATLAAVVTTLGTWHGRGQRLCVSVDKKLGRNYNGVDTRSLKGGTDMANEMGKRYRCAKCGTELIVTRAGNGAVSCCGQPMERKT